MNHEKIFKRENGTQYAIVVRMCLPVCCFNIDYTVDVYFREKGKKKWLSLPDSTMYYNIPFNERGTYIYKNQLNYVSKEEIFETKMEAWNLLKPVD